MTDTSSKTSHITAKPSTSNESLVREAIRFAIENTDPTETLCLSGIGTGIGQLNEDRFVEILAEEYNATMAKERQ